MNYKDYVKEKLLKFRKEDIKFTKHADIRIIQRQLNKEEIIENIINPIKLEYAIKEEADHQEEEKFDCYFGYTKSLCHKYVLLIKENIVVITAVKINRKWQKIVDKKMRKE